MAFLNLSSDQRVGAVGRTQMGKTFLMEQLLRPQPRVFAVDPKQRLRWPGYSLTYDPNAALAEESRIIIRYEDSIPDAWWTEAMNALHEMGGGIIYIDEMPEVTTANYMPPGLKTVFRLGAEIGVGVWWAGQEATGVHNTAIRQSDVLLLFMNQGASDRDKLMRTVGDVAEVTADLGPYEFVVCQNFGEGYDAESIDTYRYEVAA